MVGLQPNEIASTLTDAWELFGHNTEDFYDMFLANLPRDVELMANTIDRAYHPMGCDTFHIIVKIPLDYYSKESYIAHITGIQDTCWDCRIYQPDYLDTEQTQFLSYCSDKEMMSYLKDVGLKPNLSLEIDRESFLSQLATKYGTDSIPVLKACNYFDATDAFADMVMSEYQDKDYFY